MPPLLGHVSRADLTHYSSWEPLFATPYVPDAESVASIKASKDEVTVLMIVATWCPDSKREVPRFFAIMDAAGISESALTMVGVDRSKKDAEGLTEKWAITRVPTIVFLRNGQEVGRFVERTPPGSTLEAEIARVLAEKARTLHAPEVRRLDEKPAARLEQVAPRNEPVVLPLHLLVQ